MAETEKATPAKSNTSAGKTAKTAKAVKAVKSAKPAAKPAVKAAKPAAQAPKADQAQQQPAGKAVKAIKSVKAANPKDGKEEKARRVKKDKVVRDSFTMPKSDYMKIAELKQRCLDAGVSVKKSELLRAGLALLAEAQPKRLIAAVSALDTVKTGRPAKS
ncbi:hypothetical protein [Paraburkholderia sp. SOS3]|uniref:hypothetical protein n=1 Tax=Paraburkholderia sp. SOS3 TaxID=1926494 RepID=UPI0009473268|nr:hypothetical protein [Paraburkholderia sp. SOS3]APR38108.1 hypothetical protein BTO02_21515 [Paraburkholderia sp. SOS3]